ncbi:hypothetical protein GF402_08580 [Candidatus Fermentibacteria bacterium]|nr:hypothetical protein [Candidatus Fermentibacteria bacterium]
MPQEVERTGGMPGETAPRHNHRRPVLGYLCRAFPPAVAVGLGMRPLRSTRELDGEMARRGEKLVRPDVCPAVKAVLGAVRYGMGQAGRVDVWAGLATCDGTRRLFGELEGMTGKPVIPLYLPSTRTEEAEDYYAKEMKAFAKTAVDRGLAEGWDGEAAQAFEAAFRRTASVLRDLALSGEVDPILLASSLSLFSSAEPAMLGQRIAELSDGNDAGGWSPRYRVAVMEVPGAPGDDLLADALSGRGAGMVALGCGALWGVPEEPAPEVPSPRNLARDWFRSALCARSRPNNALFDSIRESLTETGAAGLVVSTLQLCDLWFTERLRLRREMPVPVLVLDRDLSPAGREMARNRLDAFLDSLEAMR